MRATTTDPKVSRCEEQLSLRLISYAARDQPIYEQESVMGRGILLWLLGVPIPVILLLALIWH